MNSHTPEEARSLWCPMVRHEGDVAAFNRGTEDCNPTNANTEKTPDAFKDKYSCTCIADKCAMWRWERTTRSVRQTTVGAFGVDVPTYEQRTVRTHGYCGLAPLHAQP